MANPVPTKGFLQPCPDITTIFHHLSEITCLPLSYPFCSHRTSQGHCWKWNHKVESFEMPYTVTARKWLSRYSSTHAISCCMELWSWNFVLL